MIERERGKRAILMYKSDTSQYIEKRVLKNRE